MDWIKLTEEKPPLNARVLIIRQGFNFYDGIYYTNIDVAKYGVPGNKDRAASSSNLLQEEIGTVDGQFPFNDITYWMPLSKSTEKLDNPTLMRMYENKLKEAK
jgi:hypothetical protein